MSNSVFLIPTVIFVVTWIIAAVRRRRAGTSLTGLPAPVADAVLFDALLIGFLAWAVLFGFDIPARNAHWVALAALAIGIADVLIRKSLAPAGQTKEEPVETARR